MAVENKIIYLNENFDIVEGNRDYYIYFERVGHRFSRIEEIVNPKQKDEFLDFIKNSKNNDDFVVLNFKKYTDEYFPNIVQVKNVEHNGNQVKAIILTDISEIFQFLKKAKIETRKIRDAFSLTCETLFSYQKNDNNFKIIRYVNGECEILFNQDIDLWKKTIIDSKYIPSNQVNEFSTFVEELKSCPAKFFASVIGGFRTAGKLMENLDFIGIKNINEEGISINGRILLSSQNKTNTESNNLIDELQIDPLTKTYNRKTIYDIAIKKINEAKDSNQRVGLLIFDLDHFKPVNDAYGHLAGDKILEQTGELLKNIVGNKGVVGRYGGDEFMIIINHVENEVFLRGILQAILETVKNTFENSFDEIKITASVGASVFPNNGLSYDELFKKSDFCLYRAKDKGRNRYVFFRDDLHLDLFKKSIEDTTGVKYEGREILELKYMATFMQTLGTTPYKAIKEVLIHMKETYGVDDISIYYGESLARVYCVGECRDEQKDAKYVLKDDFLSLLKENGHYVRIDFPEDVKNAEDFKNELQNRGIKSTIQCILGTQNEIKGLVTFDKTKSSAQWAEYEVNCAVMFAASFNLLPENTKVDFALYSKLKV